MGRSDAAPVQFGGECTSVGPAEFKPRDLGSDRGYRVATSYRVAMDERRAVDMVWRGMRMELNGEAERR